MLTICKFIRNSPPTVNHQVVKPIDNSLATRTLGKIGLISKYYKGKPVNHDELWLSKIITETCPGSNLGAFIVEPQMEIRPEELVMLDEEDKFTVSVVGGKMLVKPLVSGWVILPTFRRKLLLADRAPEEVYSVIVELKF